MLPSLILRSRATSISSSSYICSFFLIALYLKAISYVSVDVDVSSLQIIVYLVESFGNGISDHLCIG